MIRNIIFDIGGVLIDWNPRYYFDAYFNGDTQREEFFLKEICGREINRWMDEGMLPDEAGEKMTQRHPEWRREIRDYLVHWREQLGEEIPGMKAYLQSLKAGGYRLFGLTNWSAVTFKEVRKAYDITGLLEDIMISAEVKLLKPGPEIFRLLLDRHGLRADECLFTDDHMENVTGACAVGIQGILFKDKAQLEKDINSLTQ